ncbi:MAG: ABC transporter permease subunit [Anaerolineae bacterium]|nr:ABC transporter permease subunit [Anaerolineae bacterium]
MTLIPPPTGRRRPTEQEVIALELVSGLLMVIGLLAFAFLFYAIATDDGIREATQGPEIPGIGVDIRQVVPEAEGEEPYFELRPIAGGPADTTGVKAGDRLLKVDSDDVTGLTLEEVRARIAEKDVKREDDDFEIALTFLRASASGELTELSRTVQKNVAPTLAIAYLQSFGFVVPLIIIGLGALCLRLGIRLRRFDLTAARWAVVTLLWLAIGLAVGAVWAFWVNGKGGLTGTEPFKYGKAVAHAVPFLLAIIPVAVAHRWLNAVMDQLFVGEESLGARQTRFAWTLLVPTLVILALVAARPLEQTFIKSLTDDEFGTNRPARYIGLNNYQNMLSFKFATVDCRKDDGGECARTPNGSIVWEPSSVEQEERERLRTLSSEERKKSVRYQEATTWTLPGGDTGLRLLGKDPVFLNSIWNTLRFTVASVTLELLLGLIIAMVVNSSFRGRGLMRTAMLVPWAIPTVVSAVLWQTIMRGDQTGILNKLLMDLGLASGPQQWFATTGPWMNSIIAVDVWKTAPFMALLLLAGLQIIPGDLYEAASVDGASKARQFISITLPLLRPTIAVALIFRTLDALRAFDVFQVLLDTTRPSMASYNYSRLVLNRQDGYASAVGVMIFILILIFTIVYVRFVGIERE